MLDVYWKLWRSYLQKYYDQSLSQGNNDQRRMLLQELRSLNREMELHIPELADVKAYVINRERVGGGGIESSSRKGKWKGGIAQRSGECYVGQETQTKNQAEMNAAKVAYTALIEGLLSSAYGATSSSA
uniref:Double-stranded RNA-binding n=1 Tax=Tanacetum cinerariifolium TaxID=118510 RepID=A0A6L2P4M7_TANCI|nr:double-stranded RNA-binding [Tanacetum cinerariifolium]